MTASLLAKLTYLLFLSWATANQTPDQLWILLHEAFLHWRQIRRHTKQELEDLEKDLKLAKLRITAETVIGAAVGGAAVGGAAVSAAIVAPFTFGASLMVTAAGAGISALIGSYLGAEKQKKIRLSEVQVAIEKDRKACIRLQELFDSLNRTFSSTTSAGATPGAMVRNLSDALERTWRFADPSVLPWDITQLVDRHRGSTSPIVAEIRGILDNLECPDEAEIKRLVPEDETLDWQRMRRLLQDYFHSVEWNGSKKSTLPHKPAK